MAPTSDLRFLSRTVRLVDREFGLAGLHGARFQAKFAESDSAEIGRSPWGTVPHFVPHETISRMLLTASARAELDSSSRLEREALAFQHAMQFVEGGFDSPFRERLIDDAADIGELLDTILD